MSKSDSYRHTLQPVKLVYSKPVAKGYSNQELNLTPKQLEKFNKNKKKKPSVISGEILQKSIHSYRLWFRFLKLALELEQQGTVLIMREESKWKGKVRQRVTQQVVVNHSKYEGWDLDEVIENTFDNWWETHRHLFVDEISKVLNSSDSISNDPNHLTIQIDTRRRLIDVIQDLRDLNEKEKIFNHKERDKFSINGRIRPLTIQNRYNALILILEHELSNEEILKHRNQYIRPTDSRNQGGYSIPIDKNGKEYNFGSIVNELVNGAKVSFGGKQILMSVCDGYFLKHPTKTYLE